MILPKGAVPKGAAPKGAAPPRSRPAFPHPPEGVIRPDPQLGAMKVLVVLGHPRAASLNGALASAFAEGAREAGCQVVRLELGELDFAPDVLADSPADHPLEPDLERARELIEWADHLVFVFPNWWGTMPARLKGFLDRVLLPGFAFRERDGHYYGMLHGRTAELITTMDVPPPVYRWIHRAPGRSALDRATLGFCGIECTRSTAFAPASHSDEAVRRGWIERSRKLGQGLSRGPRGRLRKARHVAGTWLRAIRPQFHPMSLLAFTLGSLVHPAPFRGGALALGLLCVAALKSATVLVNDIHDRHSDARNVNWSPFTGGGRSLQEGGLDVAALRRGAGLALGLSILAGLGLLGLTPNPLGVAVTWGALAVLAIGYTAPPLKLSHRGLGELDVALTHGPGVVLLGFAVQGGSILDPLPWILGLLVGLAILPAILLSGIPDRPADLAAGKQTLAVRLGAGGAARLALGLTLASAAGAALLAPLMDPRPRALPLLAIPHALLLALSIGRYLRRGAPERRIDGLMAGSLLYIGWFVVVPVLGLVI